MKAEIKMEPHNKNLKPCFAYNPHTARRKYETGSYHFKMLPFCVAQLRFVRYVCKNFSHGSKTETTEFVLADLFCVYSGPVVCHLVALAVAHAYHPIRGDFLCAGHGHNVTPDTGSFFPITNPRLPWVLCVYGVLKKLPVS